jgi:general secretion pathway protein E
METESVTKPADLPFGFVRRKGVLVAGSGADGSVNVFAREPANPLALTELRRHLGQSLNITMLGEQQFEQMLQAQFQQRTGNLELADDIDEDLDLQRIAAELPEPEDLLENEDDAPIIRVINALLAQAVQEGASDIHIEPFENRLSVRFRVDGVLREVMAPRRALAPLLASRVKVMSRLDIAEKRLPQDGRISLRIAGRPVDVRVSTLPSGHGERVVLRLLDKQAGRLELGQLGMDDETLMRLATLIQRPHGIILVTGPTGSGKTTTLYAALQRLNDRSRNIMTVEDPVEYHIDGIGQTQVNSRVDLSFARGLRAILRQDPDVVMVGEIRDLETAGIAVQASLTGHLVLTTLHTNTAIGSITRLRDMGIEPFLLSSSLVGVLSQRLVRVLVPEWREAYTPAVELLESFGRPVAEGHQFYRPGSARPENETGYRGRTGIYELIGITEQLGQLIHDGAGQQELEAEARRHSPGILDDGWAKAVVGITSAEEVLRVTRDR